MAELARLWFGDHPHNFLPDGKFISSHDHALDSLANYYGSEKPKIPYRYSRLFLDNGAFGATRRKLDLDPDAIKGMQEYIDPDYTIPLDYPITPGMSIPVMQRRWEKTKRNTLDLIETSTLKEIVPALHAWSRTTLENHLRWVVKHADSDFIAIGSVVNRDFVADRSYFGDRNPTRHTIDMLVATVETVRQHTDFSVHFMGFGSSPLMMHLGFYCGINSMDTTGYRRGAAYGKIILPGTAWRVIGRKRRSFGDIHMSAEERIALAECRCPVCRKDEKLLEHDWKARAIHNRYVLRIEETNARRLLAEGFETYERYVDQMFHSTRRSWLTSLWEYAERRVHQTGGLKPS